MKASRPSEMPAERYARAAAFLPQNFALTMSGAVHDGYWIDDHQYFFCVSKSRDGRQHLVPSIADAQSGAVSAVLPIESIVNLLASQGEKPITPDTLAPAQYDMPDAETLVITIGRDIYRIALTGPTVVKVEALDSTLGLYSPDGLWAAFLKGHDIWVKDRRSGMAEQLTPGGEAYHAYGAMPESGTGPLSTRKYRMPAGLWSRDSHWFVTHQIDERDLPEGGLVEHAPSGDRRPIPHLFKVAGPDVDPPKGEFIACHIPSGRIVRAAERAVITSVLSPFVARSCWLTADNFYFLDWDRFSSSVSLVAMSLASGHVRTILTETTDTGWIDLHPMVAAQPIVRALERSGEIIWYSQADGRGHLYLHDLATGALKNRITEGAFVVRDIVHVDEEGRRIHFLASGFDDDHDPGYRRLCAVSFDGSGFTTVLKTDGDLSIKPDLLCGIDQLKPFRPSYAPSGFSGNGRYAVAGTGTASTETRSLLIELATGRELEIARVDIGATWKGPKPEPFEALASDGVTKLRGLMVFPTDFDPSLSYPLVDYIYPGPQVNWFPRRFPNANGLVLQAVTELGMVGVLLETRGMPNRDRAFHQAGGGRLLEPQLGDHAAVIEQLCQRHAFLDRERIGIFGQSGGGHATARALFDYPDTFKAGVSICGNHDGRNYIGYWLDKYGGHPGSRERDDQANATAAHKLQGKLLLMHGDMDDNVHPGHTLALSAALIAAGKDFDQLIIPGVTHGVLSESPYAVQRIWSYFVRHLLGAEPPANFKLGWPPGGAAAAGGMMVRDLS